MRLTKEGRDEDCPSEEVLRQIKHEEKNTTSELIQFQRQNHLTKAELLSLDWYSQLRVAADMSDKYVREIKDNPYFHMVLIMDKQLEAVHHVKPENRILHFDATGGMVDIPKK